MQRQLKGFQKEVSSLALGAAGAGTAIMGALALPVKSAITLESKMADVRKVVDGLDTPDAFKAMTEQVRALSTELPMSAERDRGNCGGWRSGRDCHVMTDAVCH